MDRPTVAEKIDAECSCRGPRSSCPTAPPSSPNATARGSGPSRRERATDGPARSGRCPTSYPAEKADCWGWHCPRISPTTATCTPTSPPRMTTGSRGCASRSGPGRWCWDPRRSSSPESPRPPRTTAGGSGSDRTAPLRRHRRFAAPEQPQDVNALGGKILRITPEGRPAPGNPFGDNPVYSLGHRNVQGLAWDSAGRLWASEFGPDVDDELNLIVPGGNYGWPEVTGAPRREGFRDAKVVWPSTAESSPSGLEIVGDTAYLGALRGQRVWAIPLNGEFAGDPVSYFTRRTGGSGTFHWPRTAACGCSATTKTLISCWFCSCRSSPRAPPGPISHSAQTRVEFHVVAENNAGTKRPRRTKTTDAPLAQLAEQLTLNQWVPGSSPGGCTTKKTPSFWLSVRKAGFFFALADGFCWWRRVASNSLPSFPGKDACCG